VSQVSGAHLHGFAPGSTHQGCSGGKPLAMCGRFDRLRIWTPYGNFHTRDRHLTTCTTGQLCPDMPDANLTELFGIHNDRKY